MQDTKNNHRLQGHLLGAFSVLVWGTTFVATKGAAAHLFAH